MCVPISLLAHGCPWGVVWSFPSLLEQELRRAHRQQYQRERKVKKRKIGQEDETLVLLLVMPVLTVNHRLSQGSVFAPINF